MYFSIFSVETEYARSKQKNQILTNRKKWNKEETVQASLRVGRHRNYKTF